MVEVTMSAEEEMVGGSSVLNQILGSAWTIPVIVLVVTAVLSWFFLKGGKKLNMPPMLTGGWPLFGTMFQTRGPNTLRILYGMSKKWGPIFTLKTGLKHVFVVSDVDIAYEALVKKAHIYSTKILAISRINYTGCRSVNSAPYGPYWREIRKNLVSQVLTTSRVEAFRPWRDQELESLIKRVKAQAKENDGVVQVLSNCRHTIFAILLHVACGEGFDDEKIGQLDQTLRRLLETLSLKVIDFLPFLQVMGWKRHKNECKRLLQEMRETFSPYIDAHRKLRDEGKPVNDYIDSLIVLQKQLNLSETDILGLIGEILAGGTDSTSDTLEWCMGELVHQPQLQARLYEEIKSVCGDRIVGEDDVDKMPFLTACLKETLRKHPPLPFALQHGVTEQTTLAGFDIPADGIMLFMLYALHNDPKKWDKPEVFNPDRFLGAEASSPDYDMTGSHGPRSFNFIPFGGGRRICPAMNLALKHMHLIVGRLVQTFEWTTPHGEPVDFEDIVTFTLLMKNRLYCRVKERSSQ